MSANNELQDAINSAAVEITKDLPADHPAKVTEEEPVTTEENEEAETTEEPLADGDDGLNEDQIKEARRLYRALNDPEAGPALVAALAQRNGLLNQPLETKKDVAVAKKDIQAIFKEELGENYGFLADRLGKAVDKALDTVRAEQNEQVQELQVQNLTREVESSLSKLAKDKGLARNSNEFKTLETQMARLMDEYPIGQSGNVDKYIRDMHALATTGKVKASVEKGTADKIRRNANNVADRLQRTSAEPSIDGLPGGKKIGLKGAVDWAVQQLEKQKK